MKRFGVLLAATLSLWLAPAAQAEPASSVETSADLLSSSGAGFGLSSDLRIPVTAFDPEGTVVPVLVGSSEYSGPTVFTQQGEPTKYFLELFQDGTLHLVARDQDGLAVKLAPDFTANTDRPSSTGTVPVPDDYVYDPFALHPGFHDYCTTSPNFYVTPELNADFRGACANHDMCMEDMLLFEYGYGWCNTALLLDIRDVCTSVYTGELERHRQGCLDTADVYYSAVTLAHWRNL
ncbi:hypothetical protein CKALI_12035 [Corynebacterium kalinowskii]|uniref:Secreted protein n=1 Tax=Corynebacterium kalinowskii TaxID=2675216 RepID=A0A6B8VWD6_9CORY|nr:hypothetical protein [Corynebacterium kalinowskii]QGU03245.1 hypothetical protein CKALI_12035 [Corynebacterium kalinowskii]